MFQVTISLGTQPGDDDVISNTSVSVKDTEFTFTDLDLHNYQTYYVTLTMRNEAGLVAMATANITVLTTPPNVTDTHVGVANVTYMTLNGSVEVGLVEDTSQLQYDLPGNVEEEVEYFGTFPFYLFLSNMHTSIYIKFRSRTT